MRYKIIEGEHKGHDVVTDKWGIHRYDYDPETAGYCLDCHAELILRDPSPKPALDSAS